MNRNEFENLSNMEKVRNQVIVGEDLTPFLKDRTLLYGYTCDRSTFHCYLKDMSIYTVVYKEDYTDIENPKHKEMRVINVTNNRDYVPDKRLYPECCDYQFCKVLKMKGIELLFTAFNIDRQVKDFYGFTLED